jgi:hypothetical protein
MEFPVRLTNIQRALALLLLAPVLWTARLESRSPIAAAVRQDRPWVGWLALKSPTTPLPQIYLVYYRPWARTLSLIYVAENLRIEDNKTLPQLAAAARREGAKTDRQLARAMAEAAARAVTARAPQALREALAAAPPLHYEDFTPEAEEPPIAAKEWAREQLRPGAMLARAARKGPSAGGIEGFELLRLALEVRGMDDDQLQAVYLPDEDADREALLTRLEPDAAPEAAATGPGGEPRPVTVEVLNATAKPGIANSAKKILRSKGADVMSTGNAPARGRTLVVDRVGRPELASRVRRMLDCPTAEAQTQVDAKRLVDVSVVLADDCALKE